LNEFRASSSAPLSPDQVELKKQQGRTNYYFRLPQSYIPFFQAMAEDYYQRGKIKAPSISLLAKTCLITACNAWNRMQAQLRNKEYERKMQQEQEQQQQNYQRRQPVQTSDIAPQSVPSIRRPPPVTDETKTQPQQDATNLLNRSMTERRHPTFAPTVDTSSNAHKRMQQYPSQTQSEDRYYYDEDYRASK
jgi:cytoskeletal protein RodZ